MFMSRLYCSSSSCVRPRLDLDLGSDLDHMMVCGLWILSTNVSL
jgi:hypothetical protein